MIQRESSETAWQMCLKSLACDQLVEGGKRENLIKKFVKHINPKE